MNWCPYDKTVLANEQVIDGACERCGTQVEQRFLEQWFFRITDYAGRLLDNLDTLDWSESTKTAQRNWIGKSEGAELAFRVQDLMEFAGSATASGGGISGEVTATPVDISRVHHARRHDLRRDVPGAGAGASARRRSSRPTNSAVEVEAYRAAAAKQDIVTRKVNKEKTGVFTGAYAMNPATGAPIPIWIADYVLMEYGTGAIMAVPGHDERDFEFARKFGLPIVRVVGHGRARHGAAHRCRLHRQREWGAGQLGPVQRPHGAGGEARDRGVAGRAWRRNAGGQLPAARLVHLAPAVLGAADPDHLLRRLRSGAGAGSGSAGGAAAARGFQARRLGHLAAGAR